MAAKDKKAKAAPYEKGGAIRKLDAFGIDAVCEALFDRESLTAIAHKADVSIGSLLTWLEADPERSARAKEARVAMARYWDEKAEAGISGAADAFDLSKAKELAHHYRWRASKVAPRDYGDKVQQEISGPDGGPIEHKYSALTDEQLAAEIAKRAAVLVP